MQQLPLQQPAGLAGGRGRGCRPSAPSRRRSNATAARLVICTLFDGDKNIVVKLAWAVVHRISGCSGSAWRVGRRVRCAPEPHPGRSKCRRELLLLLVLHVAQKGGKGGMPTLLGDARRAPAARVGNARECGRECGRERGLGSANQRGSGCCWRQAVRRARRRVPRLHAGS